MSEYSSNIKKGLLFIWNKFFDIKTHLLNSCLIFKDSIVNALRKKPQIKSVDETIDTILKSKCSVSRFGDGEYKLMSGKDISFQRYSEEIASRLKEVMKNKDENIIVCLPDIFGSLTIYEKEFQNYWRLHTAKSRKGWYSLLEAHKQYYNAFISRCYMGFRNKSLSKNWFEKMRKIWDDRDILIIEGEKSRLGVGNDLFSNAKSIKRILCPPENAFDKYEEIIKEAKKTDKSKLILLALGPAATILAYDLYREGYQAVDIGHIDIEYEWYLKGAVKKEKVEGKYVNEAGRGAGVNACSDEKYLSEILCRIR